MAEQKKAPSTNGEFKTSPLGFDKAEVMAYIVQHNKERKALKEENDELKRALEEKQQTNEGQNNELTAELEKKKAELDAQILESRKQVLDERRKLAQTEKELHVMQDKYSALTEEFTEFKKQAAAKIDKAKHSGGTIDPAQLAEISAKANADANAVIDDAQSKANEIITAAKAYFADTVKKTYDYKQSVLEKADTFANVVTSGAAAPAIDIQAVLANITASVNEAVEKALAGANAVNDAVAKAVEDTKAVNDVLAKAVEEAALITRLTFPKKSCPMMRSLSTQRASLKISADLTRASLTTTLLWKSSRITSSLSWICRLRQTMTMMTIC